MHHRHDEIRDELRYLAVCAYIKGAVREEPLINAGEANRGHEDVMIDNNNRGDLMIRGLWSRQKECILDVRVTNLDSTLYKKRDPKKILLQKSKEKR